MVRFLLLIALLVTVVNGQGASCGCSSCDISVLSRDARGQTCAARIEQQFEERGRTLEEACEFVSTVYPLECGPCHPTKCDNQAPPLCYCADCSPEVWETSANGFSCGTRIILGLSMNTTKENELAGCNAVATSFPSECGACDPFNCPSGNVFTDAPTAATITAPTSAPVSSGIGDNNQEEQQDPQDNGEEEEEEEEDDERVPSTSSPDSATKGLWAVVLILIGTGGLAFFLLMCLNTKRDDTPLPRHFQQEQEDKAAKKQGR